MRMKQSMYEQLETGDVLVTNVGSLLSNVVNTTMSYSS